MTDSAPLVETIREVLRRHSGEHLVWEAAQSLDALEAEVERLERLTEVLRQIADDPAESSQMYEFAVRRMARDALEMSSQARVEGARIREAK